MPGAAQKVLQFAGFTLDPNSASLCGAAGPLPLRPKAYDVLTYLARHPGRVVSKGELIEAIWPNIFVTDNSLVQCISDIRAALDDDAQKILKTVARRGYLFAAPVVETAAAAGGPRPSDREDAQQDRSASEDPASEAIAAAAAKTAAAAAKTGSRRRIAAALVVGVVLAAVSAAALVWRHGHPGADAGVSVAPAGPGAFDTKVDPNRVSIAFLPLVTLAAPSGDEYFADGLTEDIIAALGRFAELSVLSPNAVFPYKGKNLRPEDIGRELKVRYIAEGSIRRSPERIRVAVRLTDAAHGTLLWADQYDGEPDHIFAIQDNITRQITGALAVRLTNVEQARAAAKPPSSLEAYELVLRGRDFLSRLTRAANSNARNMFEQATALDPNYAGAYIGLGRVDLAAVALGWTADPAGALQRAQMLARKAIAIDEFNPAAHVLLGRTYARLREYDRALDQLNRAVALNPSDPNSYAGLGDALLWMGDIEGAIKALEVAVQLDPRLSTEDLFNLGAAYFLAGNSAQAIRTLERSVARSDSNAFIHAMLAAIYAEAGRKDQSDHAAAEVRRLNPFFDVASFGTLFRNPEHREKIVSALQKVGF